MAENKLADMSTEFAIQILKLTDSIKGQVLFLFTSNCKLVRQLRFYLINIPSLHLCFEETRLRLKRLQDRVPRSDS